MADNGWKVLLILGTNKYRYDHDKITSKLSLHLDDNNTGSNINSDRNINELIIKYNSHWTIKYRHIFGNSKLLLLYICVPFAILFFVTLGTLITLHFGYDSNDPSDDNGEYLWIYRLFQYIQFGTIFIGGIIVSIMGSLKVSRFTDLIYIKQETISVSVIICILIIIGVIQTFTINPTDDSLTNYINEGYFWFVWQTLATTMLTFNYVTIILYKYNPSLLFPCFKCKHGDIHHHHGQHSTSRRLSIVSINSGVGTIAGLVGTGKSPSLSPTATSVSSRRRSISKSDTKSKNRVNLNDVISHPDGYRLFMRHLVNECSVENLLFVTEIVQYKTELLNHIELLENNNINITQENEEKLALELNSDSGNENNHNDYSLGSFGIKSKNKSKLKSKRFPSLPPNIPQSGIMKEKDVFNKITMIMNRYIFETADLEVNISSLNRNNLYQRYDNLLRNKIAWKLDVLRHVPNSEGDRDSNCKISHETKINMYNFFDDGCNEIVMLLRTSLRNFRKTQQFAKFQHEF